MTIKDQVQAFFRERRGQSFRAVANEASKRWSIYWEKPRTAGVDGHTRHDLMYYVEVHDKRWRRRLGKLFFCPSEFTE